MNDEQRTTKYGVQSVALDKLVVHPDNPNKMSECNFAKLVRNIKLSGRYEPLVVRCCPQRAGFFQIINGEHRCRALSRLGYREADCIVWDVDDEQTDVLLGTLNRLCGADKLDKKIKLLERLNSRMKSAELAKLLPATKGQIERLADLKLPRMPAKVSAGVFANPMVFFVTEEQQRIIEQALSLAVVGDCKETAARRRAAGLVVMAENFITQTEHRSV